MILGLDISTSCTGLCILDNKMEIVLLDCVKLSNYKTLSDSNGP